MHARLRVLPAPLADCLDALALAPRQAYKSLTLWPLVRREDAGVPKAPPYVALADALDAGTLSVDEVGPAGRVPNIRVVNAGDTAVLVLFGEELRGAKQNRVANASFLIDARSQVDIDVSCVEQGRWSRPHGARFRASREVLSSAVRRKMALRVAATRAEGGRFGADQAEVWGEVGARLQHSGSTSRSAAYADYLHTRRRDVETFAGSFHTIERQVGFVAAIGDDIAGLELVGRPEVFERTFASLVRAYGIDAVDAELVKERAEPLGGARFDAPEAFLRTLAAAPATVGPSLGLGEDLRFDTGRVAGCALRAGDVVHLTAFPTTAV
jgi:hypothetical protein